MLRRILSWTALALAGVGCLQSARQEPSSPVAPPVTQYRAVLNRYCVTCHNEKLLTAGLTLDKISLELGIARIRTGHLSIRHLRAP